MGEPLLGFGLELLAVALDRSDGMGQVAGQLDRTALFNGRDRLAGTVNKKTYSSFHYRREVPSKKL